MPRNATSADTNTGMRTIGSLRNRLFHAFDQLYCAGGRAYLALVDDIGEHVARRFRGLGLVDARQIVRLAAAGPGLKPLRPGIELFRRITGLELVIALLQPQIDEIADDVGDRWIFAVLCEHHR